MKISTTYLSQSTSIINVDSTAVLLRLFLSSSCSCDSSLHSHSLFPLKLTGGQSMCLVWVVGGGPKTMAEVMTSVTFSWNSVNKILANYVWLCS